MIVTAVIVLICVLIAFAAVAAGVCLSGGSKRYDEETERIFDALRNREAMER